MYKVKDEILPNVLGDFVSRRDLSYNLINASSFMREKVNTTYYGTEAISILGPKIWDILRVIWVALKPELKIEKLKIALALPCLFFL